MTPDTRAAISRDYLLDGFLCPRPIMAVQLAVCAEYGISRDDLMKHWQGAGAARTRMASIRREAMVRARATGATVTQIARAFGLKDHTAVCHALGTKIDRRRLKQAGKSV